MAKIGRNQPCPCRSGKKFKHCHGGIHAPQPAGALPRDFDEQLKRAMRRAEAEHKQREKQQGLGKPIISTEVAGNRVVAVGNTIYTSIPRS
jgi:hypothetical protein